MTIVSARKSDVVRTALVAGLAIAPTPLWACAACFGASDSPMAQGMNMGIFTLLLVILTVLVGIAGFFFYIVRRAARFEAAAEGQGQPAASISMTEPAERGMPQPTHTI